MTIFKSAKVTELEARVAELETENASLSESAKSVSERNEELAGANERIVELEAANAEIPALNETIKTHEATIAGKDTEIAELTEKATITETKIGEAAAQLLAAQGHGAPLVITGEKVTQGDNKTLTREEFNALTPADRLKFVKAKGKIS